VGGGYILASLANQIGAITLTYGVVNGAGVGIAYGVPMAVVAIMGIGVATWLLKPNPPPRP
jgi:hypothetical protein